MNPVPVIYVQSAVFDKLLQRCRVDNDIINLLTNNSELLQLTETFFSVLDQPSVLNIDISIDRLKTKTNPLLKKIWKNPSVKTICSKINPSDIKNDGFWRSKSTELFILDINKDEANQIARNWGLLVLTIDNFRENLSLITKQPPIPIIKKNKSFDWNNINRFKHCFHSIFLIDNYLTGYQNKIHINLIPILRNLLKEKIYKRKLHLTIFTLEPKVSLKEFHSNLKNELQLIGIYNVCIRIVKLDKYQNHDRHIFTNILWLSIGYGLSLYYNNSKLKNKEVTSSTNIFINPIFSQSSTLEQPDVTFFNSYMALISQYADIDKNAHEAYGEINATFYGTLYLNNKA